MLNLQTAFAEIVILIILALLIHEPGRSLHFQIPAQIPFFSFLMFSSQVLTLRLLQMEVFPDTFLSVFILCVEEGY